KKGAILPFNWIAPLAMAASIAVLAGVAERSLPGFKPRTGWEVAAVSGAPRIATQRLHADARLGVGQWLETDDTSRARVSVANIGEVRLEPNSRLRLVDTSATDHRVELARGTLHALIWAPPRLFFVETPGATAVDLGCAYTLSVDPNGGGVLEVTSGYVALEHRGQESIIRAGFKCLTRAKQGPGTPFSAEAPDPLRRALERFDFEANPAQRPSALADVLALAGKDDAVTLWHLLKRAPRGQRGDVFDALVQDHPAPASVTRAGILAGDATMLNAWADELGLRY
ncbi:MAG TPA: FecR domain-containing protein, partial [Opitutaceae bacterium]|nr:FecR domain-containing protein [Opitutaceae bacterium]